MQSKILGEEGENSAVFWLKMHGVKVLETNWRVGKSEIDIVSQDGSCIVFVEVKTRSGNYYEYPESSVNASKQKAMIRAAGQWLKQNDSNLSLRFDVIAIEFLPHVKRLVHFKDAFYPM